jgi:hypothetical protein
MQIRKKHMTGRGLGIRILGAGIVLFLVAFLVAFPGRQAPMAVTLGTGVGIPGVQARVDALEAKAIAGSAFSEQDKTYLRNLYSCLATGAKLTYVLRQSGQMMAHYLSGTGDPLRTNPRIFTDNVKVMAKAEGLRGQYLKDVKNGRPRREYAGNRFYMPHPSSPDSVFGLYHGRIILRPSDVSGGQATVTWRAEVPWEWPSYETLHAQYGNHHAENFSLPNLRSLLQGRKHALYLDNGLGEYLTRLGLAKSFLVFAEWTERMPL